MNSTFGLSRLICLLNTCFKFNLLICKNEFQPQTFHPTTTPPVSQTDPIPQGCWYTYIYTTHKGRAWAYLSLPLCGCRGEDNYHSPCRHSLHIYPHNVLLLTGLHIHLTTHCPIFRAQRVWCCSHTANGYMTHIVLPCCSERQSRLYNSF